MLLKIDCQSEAGRRFDLSEQRIDHISRQDNRQNPVFEAVVEKDIGITLGNHDFESKVKQSPGRMFA